MDEPEVRNPVVQHTKLQAENFFHIDSPTIFTLNRNNPVRQLNPAQCQPFFKSQVLAMLLSSKSLLLDIDISYNWGSVTLTAEWPMWE